jgi:hypothetical protein
MLWALNVPGAREHQPGKIHRRVPHPLNVGSEGFDAVTDPLGTANSLLERSLGIDADIRVQFRPSTLAAHASFNEPTARSLDRPQEQHRVSLAIGIEFVFEGKKQSALYIQY